MITFCHQIKTPVLLENLWICWSIFPSEEKRRRKYLEELILNEDRRIAEERLINNISKAKALFSWGPPGTLLLAYWITWYLLFLYFRISLRSVNSQFPANLAVFSPFYPFTMLGSELSARSTDSVWHWSKLIRPFYCSITIPLPSSSEPRYYSFAIRSTDAGF